MRAGSCEGHMRKWAARLVSFQAQQWQRGQSSGAPAASTSPSPNIRLSITSGRTDADTRAPDSRLNDAQQLLTARAAINLSGTECVRVCAAWSGGGTNASALQRSLKINVLTVFHQPFPPLFLRPSILFHILPFWGIRFAGVPPPTAAAATTHAHTHSRWENI